MTSDGNFKLNETLKRIGAKLGEALQPQEDDQRLINLLNRLDKVERNAKASTQKSHRRSGDSNSGNAGSP